MERGFDALLSRYRSACPDPEPTPAFTPGIWKRIDGRRSIGAKIAQYARGLVTVAATACLLMLALDYLPSDRSHEESITYVEALGVDAEAEVVAYASYDQGNALSGGGGY
jgi:hypothetical protein